MTIFKQWRLWFSLLLVMFCFYFIKPNFSDSPQDFKINFGLDIQGGYSYLLELNEEEYKQNLLIKISQALESSYDISSKIDEDFIYIPANQNLEKLNNIIVQSLGLEIADQTSEGAFYNIITQYFNNSLSDMTLNAVEIVRSRIDFLGNKELSIQKIGL